MRRWPGNPEAETTTFGGLKRSSLMSRVRSRGNRTTEEKLAILLREKGISGWRRNSRVHGQPDFVWQRYKIAVFVDGCFWHGHNCRNLTPSKNRAAWLQKFSRTKLRDRYITRSLRKTGWNVIRIWECKLNRAPDRIIKRITKALDKS